MAVRRALKEGAKGSIPNLATSHDFLMRKETVVEPSIKPPFMVDSDTTVRFTVRKSDFVPAYAG